MIRIHQWPLPDCEDTRAFEQRALKARERVVRRVGAGQPAGPFEDQIWRTGPVPEYLKHRNGPFRQKCAYCDEAVGTSAFWADIDHFRPKGSPRDAHGELAIIGTDAYGKPIPHPGYYWLAYDHQNYRLACERCNRECKRDYFPVVGVRAASPGYDGTEEPLLVDPCGSDDPSLHLQILENGVLVSLTDKGRATIEILGLNKRSLPDSRKEAYKEMKRWIKEYVSQSLASPPSLDDISRDHLQAAYCGYFSHTIARRLAYHHIRDAYSAKGISIQIVRIDCDESDSPILAMGLRLDTEAATYPQQEPLVP